MKYPRIEQVHIDRKIKRFAEMRQLLEDSDEFSEDFRLHLGRWLDGALHAILGLDVNPVFKDCWVDDPDPFHEGQNYVVAMFNRYPKDDSHLTK